MADLERFREPQRRWAHATVPAASPRPWPSDVGGREGDRVVEALAATTVVGAGRTLPVSRFLDMTTTTALVVVVDGRLVHEWYAPGVGADDRLLGNSATKSALAHLTGLALRAGDIDDLDVDVCRHVPELSGSGYDGVSVRQVLTMTSGVSWVEDYHDPHGPAAQLLRRWTDQLGDSRQVLRELRPEDPPGSRFVYCSPDSMVLDWVRERASGLSYQAALTDLWAALGAETPAVVGLDRPEEDGGVAVAAGALAATARDWARLGWLQVDGAWLGSQLLDPSWVTASSRPELPFLRPGRLPSTITAHAGFGYHWWPLDDAGETVMADGMQGQFVYVDRPGRTVVVKTSAWPYADPWWDRQCRDLSYLALPVVARAAAEAAGVRRRASPLAQGE